LTKDGVIKIGDLGFSKMIGGKDFASTFAGTGYYMSPELFKCNKIYKSLDLTKKQSYTLTTDIW